MILALVALTCWLGFASSAAAQSMLSGVVRDPGGQVASSITVIAENEKTGEVSEARSSNIGLFAFYHLPPGRYTISVSHPSLAFFEPGVEVLPRQKRALDIKLSFQEHVTVRTPNPLPRRLRDGSLGASFSREALDGMFKSNGENLQSVLTAIPLINFTESVGTLAQFTALGQRRFSNRLTIDGVSADLAIDVAALGLSQAASATLPGFATTGATHTLIPLSAVEEIQIRTSNASPEHARSPGAQTTIVTRSGTDRFRASSAVQVRPDALAARDWFRNSGARPQARRRYWDSSLSLGGPILPRRLFYFGTWERQHIDRSVFTKVNVPSLSLREAIAKRPGGTEIVPLIEAYPLPNGPETAKGVADLTARFPVISSSNTLSVRLDAALSNVHRSFVRFHRGTSAGDALSSSLLPSYSFSNTESTRTETTTAGLTSAWRTVTHDFRANVATHRGSVVASSARLSGAQPLPYTSLVAPGVAEGDALITISLIGLDGGLLQSGRIFSSSQEQLQFVDNWSFLLGRHEWRLGLEYQRVTASLNPAQHRYTYRFPSIDEFAQGLARFVIVQNFNPASARREVWSLFATDNFRVSPRLSLNYGLRYTVKPAPFSRTELTPYLIDFDSLTPNELPSAEDGPLWNTSWKDLAPRVAATYQAGIAAGWETSVRAGASLIFDDRSNSGIGVFGSGYGYVANRGIPNSPFPVPANNLFVVTPDPFASGDVASYYSFPKELRTPRTYEWHFGVDQNLGRTQQLSVAYVGTTGRDLIYWHTYDVGVPLVQAYSNDASSEYHALLVEYVRRRSRGLQGSVSYTLSHALDNDSGEPLRGHAPPELLSPSLNWGSADFDRRHVLRIVGSYQVPALRAPRWLEPVCQNWQVDAVLTAQTGTPVSVSYLKTFDFGTYTVRPDAVSDAPTWIVDPLSPGGRHINPNAFVLPTEPRPGTLGRNTLRAFPLRQVDLSLSRPIRLGQRLIVHVRFDAFNAFNTPNFGPPYGSFGSNEFGVPDRSYAESLGTGTLQLGGLMPIQQLGGSRSLQFGVRLSY